MTKNEGQMPKPADSSGSSPSQCNPFGIWPSSFVIPFIATLPGPRAGLSFAAMFRCLTACLLAGLMLFSGCVPESSSQDEERDAHFLAGRQRLLNRDVDGAIAEFEQALQLNPKHSLAHFELAVVYKTLKNDDASAIYHYQKCIAAQPNGPRRPLAEQAIKGSRQDIAKAEQDSMNGAISRIYQQTMTTNQVLVQRVQMLEAELNRVQALLRNLGAASAVQTNFAQPSYPAQQPDPVSRIVPRPNPAPASQNTQSSTTSRPEQERPAPQQRTHTIRQGENLGNIAKRYGVPLSKLLAANRNLDARKLKIGQTIVIPAP